METPFYLIVRSKAPNSRFDKFCASLSSSEANLVAKKAVHEVSVLEPGSIPTHCWIGRFAGADMARACWQSVDTSLLNEPEEALVLLAKGIPSSGLEDDFIPTKHNVDSHPSQSPTLMIIEGSATDQEAMDQYRDIILPMMKELEAYYIVFQLGGDIEVLSGNWNEAIFAISRWPNATTPKKFWLSPRYQNHAIPLRLGISQFQVVTFEGEPDD